MSIKRFCLPTTDKESVEAAIPAHHGVEGRGKKGRDHILSIKRLNQSSHGKEGRGAHPLQRLMVEIGGKVKQIGRGYRLFVKRLSQLPGEKAKGPANPGPGRRGEAGKAFKMESLLLMTSQDSTSGCGFLEVSG